jgi:hypothetical protein
LEICVGNLFCGRDGGARRSTRRIGHEAQANT